MHGKQCMPCSANFSMTLQTEILSTETSFQLIFPKLIIILNFVFLGLLTALSVSADKTEVWLTDSVPKIAHLLGQYTTCYIGAPIAL